MAQYHNRPIQLHPPSFFTKLRCTLFAPTYGRPFNYLTKIYQVRKLHIALSSNFFQNSIQKTKSIQSSECVEWCWLLCSSCPRLALPSTFGCIRHVHGGKRQRKPHCEQYKAPSAELCETELCTTEHRNMVHRVVSHKYSLEH